MNFLSFQNLFSSQAAQAICRTLGHSLWQGLLLAATAAAVIFFTRHRSALVRYNLLAAALLLFISGTACTFYLQVNEPVNASLAISNPVNEAANAALIFKQSSAATTTATAQLTHFLNEYSFIIVFGWLLMVALKSVKLMTGLYSIQQIKKRKVQSAGSYWSMRVQQMATQLGIRTHIQFVQSGIVKVPMVIGHFKPVIFFPLGALTSLSPEEVEAILLHELAHIRRRDYLVNLLQHFSEIVFFFNPGLLWVSALLKTERENCCDDIALQHTGDKKNYINALVSFQELDYNAPFYATAFTHRKEQLLKRVKRMIGNNNRSLGNMEKTVIAGCLLLTGLFSLVYAQDKKQSTSAAIVAQLNNDYQEQKFVPAEIPEGTSMEYPDGNVHTPRTYYVFKKNGTLYEVYGDITWIKVNAKLVPRDQWKLYTGIIADLRKAHSKLKTLPGLNDTLPATAIRLQEQAILLQQKAEARADSARAASEKAYQQQAATMKVNDLKQLGHLKQMAEHDKTMAIHDEQMARHNEQMAASEKHSAKVAITRTETNDKGLILTGISYSNDKANGPDPKKLDIEEVLNDITQYLEDQKIISKREGLSYLLTSESFIVNGKVQPADIHRKLKDKYIQSADWKMMHNWRSK